MFRPRSVAVLAVLAVLSLAGCGSSQSVVAASAPRSSSTSESTSTISDTPSSSASTESAPATTASPAPAAMVGKAVVAYQKGRMPTSSGSLEAYVQIVRRSNQAVWAPAFEAAGISMPMLQYDATMKGEVFNSHCQLDGARIALTSTSTYMLYCGIDMPPYGQIAIPASVLDKLWNNGQPNRKVAELAVALAVSRQAGLVMVTALQQQLGMQQPKPANAQYMAACMAGVWAHGVYALGDLTDAEMSNALIRALTIPSYADGTLTTPQPNDDMYGRAWGIGFLGDEDNPGGGNVATCVQKLWSL